MSKKVTRHLSGTAELVPLDQAHAAGGDEERRVKFQFANEDPIKLPWGDQEVFGHKRGEFDFSKLNNGAPFLRDHDNSIDSVIGVIEKAWVEGRKSYAIARLDKGEQAREYIRKVENGMLKDVSMGVAIMGAERIKKLDGGGSEWRITSWQPKEVSAVAMGRIQGAELISLNSIGGDGKMSGDNTGSAAKVEDRPVDTAKMATDAKATADARVKDVLAMGERFAYAGGKEVASDILKAGGGMEEFLAKIDPKLQQHLKEASSPEGQRKALEDKRVGMSEKDVKNFSYANIFRHLMDPHNREYAE